MSIFISTRPATNSINQPLKLIISGTLKCKDCKFLKEFYKGKRKLHKCDNDKSPRYNQFQRLIDRVCDVWELL